ncbi:spermidine/putrescine ABC transporter permease [Pseudomonas straminea]|uniref:Putative spermidine/putrescine transport system permease protein n=1 Tax=Pseudomonas straminea TaxID=47882 RepID=A0A1I1S476_PSEOC|nr:MULTISPECIES: ABC transporter permease [Pseudomonas]TWE06590.1 putative spermidine/putrescine transport system permease protein [Pseudomonas sp. AG1028]GLX11889.1 spermidine/putrescine ABC transporter permease [Pseudomonas straminea]SFD41289.1 putative spermidine/putrescine transport system permease protein [Pseudomonas straminea]
MLLSPNAMGRGLRYGLNATTALIAVFLLLPILFIVLLSFGSSQWLVFPPPGWTLKWYGQFFSNAQWMDSALVSLKVALLTTVCALAIGLPSAFALVRGKFPGRELLYALFTLPMIVPLVIIAVAVYALFLKLGYTGTLFAFVVSHVIVALPFTIISIINSLKLFDQSIEDAAVICGATRLQAIVKVTFPAIRPGLVSGGLFAFLVSWDEVVLSVMMASPGLQTLPVKMWTTLRQDLTPVIAVASTLLIALSLLVMFIAAIARRRAEAKG